MSTVYIHGTKKQANERLAAGQTVSCDNYSLFSGEPDRGHIQAYPVGTVVKFYTKVIDGNPYAKGYGNWHPLLNKIV